MADKKHKRPRHANLVIPGEKPRERHAAQDTQKDRLGRAVTPDAVQPPAPEKAPEAAENTANGAAARPGPENAAAQAPGAPKKKPRLLAWPKGKKLSPARRKRRRKRIRVVVVLVLLAAILLFYTSGAYLGAATAISELYDTLRIAARPGDGFPATYGVNGFVQAVEMPGTGFAALGEKDVVMLSDTGVELNRITHGYLSPGVSAGKTRMVVYSRGGKEYTVEGRSQTLASRTTERDILFCEMSPGGMLAVATSSRYVATLEVFDPPYDAAKAPLYTYRLADDSTKPVLAAFHSDNRNLLLACYSAQNGALGTTLYMLRTDRDSVQGEIRVPDARILKAGYLSNQRFVAIYDTFTALYSAHGEEISRYSYGSSRPVTADFRDGMTALVFGSTANETLHAMLLNERMEVLVDTGLPSDGATRALPTRDGLFVMTGQWVYAYNTDGALTGTLELENRSNGLVWGGQPLALTIGLAVPLGQMLDQPAQSLAPSMPPASSLLPDSSFGMEDPLVESAAGEDTSDLAGSDADAGPPASESEGAGPPNEAGDGAALPEEDGTEAEP